MSINGNEAGDAVINDLTVHVMHDQQFGPQVSVFETDLRSVGIAASGHAHPDCDPADWSWTMTRVVIVHTRWFFLDLCQRLEPAAARAFLDKVIPAEARLLEGFLKVEEPAELSPRISVRGGLRTKGFVTFNFAEGLSAAEYEVQLRAMYDLLLAHHGANPIDQLAPFSERERQNLQFSDLFWSAVSNAAWREHDEQGAAHFHRDDDEELEADETPVFRH